MLLWAYHKIKLSNDTLNLKKIRLKYLIDSSLETMKSSILYKCMYKWFLNPLQL